MSAGAGESEAPEASELGEDVTMQALVIESIGRAPSGAWLIDGSLRTVEGPSLRVAIGANRGLGSVVCSLERLGIAEIGEIEILAQPFEDFSGRRITLTKTGRRALDRISTATASKPVGPACTCPLCTGAQVKPQPKTAPKKPQPEKKTEPPARKPVRKPSRKSSRVRVAMILVREIDEVCRYCMSAPATTTDHVRPLDRGGSHSPFNLVGCCRGCNGKKDNLYPREAGMVLHVPLRWFTSTGLKLWR